MILPLGSGFHSGHAYVLGVQSKDTPFSQGKRVYDAVCLNDVSNTGAHLFEKKLVAVFSGFHQGKRVFELVTATAANTVNDYPTLSGLIYGTFLGEFDKGRQFLISGCPKPGCGPSRNGITDVPSSLTVSVDQSAALSRTCADNPGTCGGLCLGTSGTLKFITALKQWWMCISPDSSNGALLLSCAVLGENPDGSVMWPADIFPTSAPPGSLPGDRIYSLLFTTCLSCPDGADPTHSGCVELSHLVDPDSGLPFWMVPTSQSPLTMSAQASFSDICLTDDNTYAFNITITE